MPTHFSLKPGTAIQPFYSAAGNDYLVETASGRRFKLSGKAGWLLEQIAGGTALETFCMVQMHLGDY